MSAWLVGLSLSVALVLTPIELVAKGPWLPWQTFSGAAKDSQGSQRGYCAPGREEIFIGVLMKHGDRHVYYFEPESLRLVWVVFVKDAPEPEWVGVGIVAAPPKHDAIPSLTWYTYAEALKAFPTGPCGALVPAKT